MKFVIVSHSERLAGAERSLFAIVAAACEAEHQVVVTVPRPGPLKQKIETSFPQVRVIVVPTHSWMHGEGFSVKSVPRTLVSIIEAIPHSILYRRLSPDFVVVNSSVIPGPILAARICRIPSFVMIRESILTNTQLYSVIPKSLLIKFIKSLSTFRFAVSEFVASQMNEHCTVDYPDVRRDLGVGENIRIDDHASDQPSSRIRAVMLGSYSDEKGQADAIKAVAIARAAGADVELSLFGYSREEQISEMKEWCRTNGIGEWIRHRGFTDDPLEAYRYADVAVVCSKNEAYGRVTAEALILGIPVVGYALGGTAEILRGGGGIACKPTPSDLARVLTSLVKDPKLLSDLRYQCQSLSADGADFGDSAKTVSRMVEKIAGIKAVA
ncbi:glycosyltransferase family 4 protein [Arthrobacter sp. 2MCAF15]|uniref:glycosyltransferase family 4 protein n=1 Tax=Arthrobacter sp. 2MCAF15 TaxID=3232984 RepID=UPI003F921A97